MTRTLSLCIALLSSGIALLTSCSSGDKWHVKATINDANGKTALLEVSDNGRWNVLDSATIGNDGKCSFDRMRTDYPDIYRITVEKHAVYFPVDSTETVSITADYADMDVKSSISGSKSAETMQQINDQIARALSTATPEQVVNNADLKRNLALLVQDDWASISAYYLINKTIGNQRLFNPAIAFDRGIISAVANAYLNVKPNDPRTKLLEQLALSNRRNYGKGTPIQAVEIYFPEITLADFNKKEQSLSELWQKSKVTILNFTAYTAEESPALQILLGEVYKKYHDRGLNIYQVGCDPEEYRWRMAAESIPWTAVYCAEEDATQLLRYNVSALPTTFVIDASGEHIERVDDIATLDATVAKYI